MFDLGTLTIQKLIVHEVPEKTSTESDGGPILSQVESSLTPDLRNYFRERISESLLRAPFEVVLSSETSPVPALVEDQLGAMKNSFVKASQQLGKHLYSSQTRVNSGGLLVAMKGKVDSHTCFGVLKLEKEEGIRAHQEEVDGKRTFNLEHLQDLFLNKKTRVFKVGLFAQTGTSASDIEGYVSDNQRGFEPRTEVADFFLRKFLGCELEQAPEITTSRFLEVAQAFVNDEVEEASDKADYNIALHSEFTSQRTTLSPRGFAMNHLKTEHRQPFIAAVETSGIPAQTFDKDTTLIAPRLRRIEFDFDSGIALLGPPDALDDRVSMKAVDGGETKVEFTDRVKDVRGKR